MSEQKRGRGQPRHYKEIKEKRSVRVTDTAWESLDTLGFLLGMSRSEVVERFARLPQEEALEMLTKNRP
jgi:hypothetical protein